MSTIVTRNVPGEAVARLTADGMPPLLARIYAARGILSPQQLATDFDRLLPPAQMLNLQRMAQLLADAIAARRKLLIVADYDADGATACAVGLRALRGFGAIVDYLVPNRFEYGYGLTPEIVRLAHDTKKPDILITVDNGIASVDGVAEANSLGLKVLITDHHLPGERLPDAWCIINPNQPGCTFPSKNLAGVGVMFYLMLALRAELRERGVFQNTPSSLIPHPSSLIPHPSSLNLNRRLVRLAGADADHLVDAGDEDFAVADLAGARRLDNGVYGALQQLVGNDHLDFHFRQKIDHVLGAAIELGMPFLTPETLDFGYGQPADADFGQRLAHLIELERFKNGLDFFHCFLPDQVRA